MDALDRLDRLAAPCLRLTRKSDRLAYIREQLAANADEVKAKVEARRKYKQEWMREYLPEWTKGKKRRK